MIICDGCNVDGNWEHRCHGENAFVGREATRKPCECKPCEEPRRKEKKMGFIYECLDLGIEEAKRVALNVNFEIGQFVAYPADNDMVYILRGIWGKIAVVEIPKHKSPTGKKITKEVPLCELYDPNVAKDFGLKEMAGLNDPILPIVQIPIKRGGAP